MKKIFTLFVLLITGSVLAQLNTEKLLPFYKSDDAVGLQKLITKQNKNDCINIKDFEYTLLVLAIKFDRKKIFDMLLKNKVDIEKSCGSKSPLMYASKYGNLVFAKKLVKAGARVSKRNYKGVTALDYANKYEQKEVLNYLRSRLQ